MRQGWTCAPAAVWLLVAIAPAAVGLAGPPAEQGGGRTPLPDERLGVRTAPLLLLSRPDVRADLGLNDKQADAAEAAITDLYVRAAALKGTSGPQAVSLRKAIDEAQRQWFETHLTAEQLNRLDQIDLQWEGPSALVSRPIVSDSLGLTPDQRLKLKQAVGVRNAARVGGATNADAEQTLAKQSLALLSVEQKSRWRTMLGNPFAPRLSAGNAGSRTVR